MTGEICQFAQFILYNVKRNFKTEKFAKSFKILFVVEWQNFQTFTKVG